MGEVFFSVKTYSLLFGVLSKFVKSCVAAIGGMCFSCVAPATHFLFSSVASQNLQRILKNRQSDLLEIKLTEEIIMSEIKQDQGFSLEEVITAAVKIPGVKVDRKEFLAKQFANETVDMEQLLEKGPVQARIGRKSLSKMANKLILSRTAASSLASFAAGIPGGLAIAVAIPADTLQFFGVTLRLAQELAYLYGAEDLWDGVEIDEEAVRNQLILYCGAMFSVTGASAGVRLLSSQLAKVALKKIPQKALMKTIWYPILKKICKAIGIKMTKQILATSVSKVIPVIGGVISGGLNFASMYPMAKRLAKTLDEANFDYTQEEIDMDLNDLADLDDDGDTIVVDADPSSDGEG